MPKIKVHDFKDVWKVLSELPRTLSVKTLRHLQSMIFDFVTSANPTGKILVNGIDELDTIENLEVVVGFGNISKLEDKGIIGLKIVDLLRDILFNDIPSQNYHDIVEKLLPSVVKQKTFVPFFKYQKECKNLNPDNSLKNHMGSNFTLERANAISIDDYRVHNNKAKIIISVKKYNSISDLIEDLSPIHTIQKIPYLSPDKIDIKVLADFLKLHWDEFIGEKEHIYASHYRKCICLLDFLTYSYPKKKEKKEKLTLLFIFLSKLPLPQPEEQSSQNTNNG